MSQQRSQQGQENGVDLLSLPQVTGNVGQEEGGAGDGNHGDGNHGDGDLLVHLDDEDVSPLWAGDGNIQEDGARDCRLLVDI